MRFSSRLCWRAICLQMWCVHRREDCESVCAHHVRVFVHHIHFLVLLCCRSIFKIGSRSRNGLPIGLHRIIIIIIITHMYIHTYTGYAHIYTALMMGAPNKTAQHVSILYLVHNYISCIGYTIFARARAAFAAR